MKLITMTNGSSSINHEIFPEVAYEAESAEPPPSPASDQNSFDLNKSPPKSTSPTCVGKSTKKRLLVDIYAATEPRNIVDEKLRLSNQEVGIMSNGSSSINREIVTEVAHETESAEPLPSPASDQKSLDLNESPPKSTSPTEVGKLTKKRLLVDIYAATNPGNIVDEKLRLSNQEVGIIIDFSRYKMEWIEEDGDEARMVDGCKGDDDWDKSVSAFSKKIKKKKTCLGLASQEKGKKRMIIGTSEESEDGRVKNDQK